jgi:predicted short-subunit dehydrogenase-like oxidoreductase (DUF2520 family)
MAERPIPDESRPPAAIVGAGAMGTTLAHRLRGAGYPVATVLSRSARSAQTLATAVDAPTASTDLTDLPERARLVFLTVPDAQVTATARALAERRSHPWPHCLAAHTSGALPAAVLGPLAEAGATTLGFHPLQAFTRDTPPEAFDGICIGLEGAPDALAAGRSLAEALGARPLALPASAKTRYHLAASMASNFLVTLMAMAGDVLDDALDGLPDDAPQGLPDDALGDDASDSRIFGNTGATNPLLPLVQGTLRNVRDAAPEAALTGPIARGDEDTVSAHVEALRAHHPGFLPVYVALATETVRLAARTDRFPPAVTDRLLRLLADALEEEPGASHPGFSSTSA